MATKKNSTPRLTKKPAKPKTKPGKRRAARDYDGEIEEYAADDGLLVEHSYTPRRGE